MKLLRSFQARQTVAIGFAVIAMVFGQDVPFKDQWPFYEALRTTAGIIFAVIGAWITVIYPRGIERVLNRKIANSDTDVRNVSRLLEPLLYSTIVLAIVLIGGPVSLILKQITLLSEHAYYLRAFSFGLLIYLTLVQMWSLFLTLRPAQFAHEEMSGGQHTKDLRNRLQSLTQAN